MTNLSKDLQRMGFNLIKLFFRYANFVKRRFKSCKCFKGFQVFLFDFYLCGLIFLLMRGSGMS